jgi:adenosylcobinamide amidohydrolase
MRISTVVEGETLRETSDYRIQRNGRFLITELLQPYLVLSTSLKNGGQCDQIRFMVNHQSCEGTDHVEREAELCEAGQEKYHDRACREVGLDPSQVALMGTAANMNYASIVTRHADDVEIIAIVTAGVLGNAACAADIAMWSEREKGFERVSRYGGTVNSKLLIGRSLTAGALAGAVTVIAEAKSTALQQLAVRSRYSSEFATGTNTDQYCIACRLDDRKLLTNTGTGVRLGQVIAQAIKEATLEALRWQNGLEPSYARSIFHALGCYGLTEESFPEDIAPYLSETHLRLLKGNLQAIVYEPLVAAAAYAMATVLDRLRHGILPRGTALEALKQQAASMAAGLAAQPDRWPEIYRSLQDVELEHPARLVLRAIAMGWSAKWI